MMYNKEDKGRKNGNTTEQGEDQRREKIVHPSRQEQQAEEGNKKIEGPKSNQIQGNTVNQIEQETHTYKRWEAMLVTKLIKLRRHITTTSPRSPITFQGMILILKLIELIFRVGRSILLLLDSLQINNRVSSLRTTSTLITTLNLPLILWFNPLLLG